MTSVITVRFPNIGTGWVATFHASYDAGHLVNDPLYYGDLKCVSTTEDGEPTDPSEWDNDPESDDGFPYAVFHKSKQAGPPPMWYQPCACVDIKYDRDSNTWKVMTCGDNDGMADEGVGEENYATVPAGEDRDLTFVPNLGENDEEEGDE